MKLQQAIARYVSLKQSLGFRFATDRQILKAFSHPMGKIRMGQVKPTAVRAYLDGRGPVTRSWERQWVALRGLYAFALARGFVRRSPLPAYAPKVARTFTAYSYSVEELRRLLQAITSERAPKGGSARTLRTLALLFYGAGGYRQGVEASSLLARLSAYWGHVDIAGTQKYLTTTPELREQASARFVRYALGRAS